jgi:hypothetical protein
MILRALIVYMYFMCVKKYNIPRIGYIANYIGGVIDHFEKYLPQNCNQKDVWFEINRVPLKWYV